MVPVLTSEVSHLTTIAVRSIYNCWLNLIFEKAKDCRSKPSNAGDIEISLSLGGKESKYFAYAQMVLTVYALNYGKKCRVQEPNLSNMF